MGGRKEENNEHSLCIIFLLLNTEILDIKKCRRVRIALVYSFRRYNSLWWGSQVGYPTVAGVCSWYPSPPDEWEADRKYGWAMKPQALLLGTYSFLQGPPPNQDTTSQSVITSCGSSVHAKESVRNISHSYRNNPLLYFKISKETSIPSVDSHGAGIQTSVWMFTHGEFIKQVPAIKIMALEPLRCSGSQNET